MTYIARSTIAAAAIMVAALAVMPLEAARAQIPPARVLFLDLDKIFQQSAVGTDIRGQLEGMLADVKQRADAAEKQFAERELALIGSAEGRPEEELRKEWETLSAERAGQMQVFQLERTGIQAASGDARRKVNGVLNEIMREILVERGANMILDVTAVHVGGVDYDVTADVIARLDERMPSLKVEPPKPKN